MIQPTTSRANLCRAKIKARRAHEITKVVECTTHGAKVAQTAEKCPQNEKEREEWERTINEYAGEAVLII